MDAESTALGAQNTYSFSVGRIPAGCITGKTETMAGERTNYTYIYDSMGRLLRYDGSGRRNYEMNALRGIAGTTLSYDNEDHLLSFGTTTYQYNLDGFLTSRTQGTAVSTYNYSSRGELLSVNLPDGRLIEFIHDPLGMRIAKRINGVIIEKYLWKQNTGLAAVYDGNDNLLMRFKYGDGTGPIATAKAGSNYHLAYDQIGSLRLVTDNSGNVVKRIDYDSFGNILADTNPGFVVPFGFAGGLQDHDVSLVHFGLRDYNPEIGTWTAKDPILFNGGDTNLYGYVQDNPINVSDPSGCGFIDCAKALAELADAMAKLAKREAENVAAGKCDPGHDKAIEQAKNRARNALEKARTCLPKETFEKIWDQIKSRSSQIGDWISDHRNELITGAGIGAGVGVIILCPECAVVIAPAF